MVDVRRSDASAASASARASGVDREPGHTTASVTPARTHSSTRVAANVACTSAGPAGAGRRAGRGAVSSSQRQEFPAVVLHSERDGVRAPGRAAARLHPDRPVLGTAGAGARPRPRGRAARRCPATAARAPSRPTCPTTGRLAAAAGGPAIYLGYSMGGRLALHVATERPRRCGAWCSGRHARHRGRRRAGRAPAADEALAARIGPSGVDAFLDAWLAQPLFAGLPPEAPFEDERRRNTAAGLAAACALAGTGSPGAAVGPLAGRSMSRCWSWPARTTALRRHRRAGRRRRSAPTPAWRSSPAPATAPTWSSRRGSWTLARAVAGAGDRLRPVAAGDRVRSGSGGQAVSQRPSASRAPNTSWTRPVRPARGSGRRPGAAQHGDHRPPGQRDRRQGQRRRRPPPRPATTGTITTAPTSRAT